jgi:thioredoxin 1
MSQVLEVTDTSFDAEVKKSSIPVLVDFWAPWCGPCRAMGPTVDKISQELGGKLKVVKHNTQDHPDTASSLGVMAIPCFVVFKGGKEIARHTGGMAYPQFKAFVESHLN